MKKLATILLAAAIFIPATVMAQGYKPNQKPTKPGYNGPVAHPGNGGGIHSYPGNGNNQPNHGNNGNNSGYNNGNNGSYNNGNNGGYNNGNNSNHGNNGGYNQPGHGNHGPAINHELINTHRSISRAFRTVENSYFPIFMSHDDKRKMGYAIGMLSSELSGMMRLVDRRHRDEIRDIAMIVERAKFVMFTENDVRGAYRTIQRAENRYNILAGMMIGR